MARVDPTGFNSEALGSVSDGMRTHLRYPRRPAPTPVTIFQAGHGWTFTGTTDGTSNLNDTTDFVLGLQSAKLVTAGGGVSGNFGKLAMTSMDLTGRSIIVWLKVENRAHLTNLQMFVGSSSLANNWLLDIAAGSTPITEGEWIPFVFNFSTPASTTGAPNRAAITDMRFRVQDDNTGNKVTVHFGGVGHFANPTAFPNGVATIWWDDVYLDAYNSGRPYMDIYNYQGVCSPIIDVIGNGTYLTLPMLQSLRDDNGWQVTPHAYAQAVHDNRYTSVSTGAVFTDMYLARDYLSKQGFQQLDDFAWPGGVWGTDVTPAVETVAREFYRFGRLTTYWPRQPMPPAMPLRTQALNGQTLSLANFQIAVDNTFTNGDWAIFVWHQVDANFNAKMDYLNTKGIPVRTAADVLTAIQ